MKVFCRCGNKGYSYQVCSIFLFQEHNFHPDMILPHGSYLVNCGSPSADTVAKSKACLLDELKRCEQLGLTKYNFHPGSSCGKQTVEKTITQIAQAINECHQKTEYVTTGEKMTNIHKYSHPSESSPLFS